MVVSRRRARRCRREPRVLRVELDLQSWICWSRAKKGGLTRRPARERKKTPDVELRWSDIKRRWSATPGWPRLLGWNAGQGSPRWRMRDAGRDDQGQDLRHTWTLADAALFRPRSEPGTAKEQSWREMGCRDGRAKGIISATQNTAHGASAQCLKRLPCKKRGAGNASHGRLKRLPRRTPGRGKRAPWAPTRRSGARGKP